MRPTAIRDLSVGVLQELYRSSRATPAEVIAGIYNRIETEPLNPVWITLVPRELAIARARSLGANLGLPLYGIPFAVKDNIDAAGSPTTAACPEFVFTPAIDAFVVDRLLKAGAILIGKTNLDQFATGLAGTRTPYGACSSVFNASYISGGSSSGSAVAVASGLVTFALGTDTAGSGRVPAAFNNIIGLKPSRGLLSTTGVVPACRSLDCVSIFALSSSDACTVFNVAEATDPVDPFSRSASVTVAFPRAKLRIGTPQSRQLEFFGDKEYERLYAETLQVLTRQGHSIIEIDFEPFRSAAELLYAGPYVAERSAAVGEFVRDHPKAVDPIVGAIVTSSGRWTAADAYQGLYKLKALAKVTEQAWSSMDTLLVPTAPTTYTIEEIESEPIQLNSRLGYYTNFVNLLDLCAVAIPAGFTDAGLPFGVTAISPAFSDRELLAFAAGIQKSRAPMAGKNLSPIADFSLPPAPQPDGLIYLGVVGAHLAGQPLNHQLTDRGATLVRTTKTASNYQMFALESTSPAKPGLLRVPGFAGPGIEIEVWAIPVSQFGSFVAGVPAPLSIGTCELSDGSSVKGFLCEPYGTVGMSDVTRFAGWRRYLDSRKFT